MAAKGKSRGQNWSERETQALVSIWSEDRIQRELKKSVRNDLAFAQISRELAERGYVRTVVVKGLQSSSHRCQPPSPSPRTISSLSSPANRQEINEHNHEIRRRHLTSHLIK